MLNAKDSKTMFAASRIASLGAIWLATKAIETKKGQRWSKKADDRLERITEKAGKKALVAKRNVSRNGRLAVAGLIVIAVGGVLLGKAAKG